jgi:hypothetical protein
VDKVPKMIDAYNVHAARYIWKVHGLSGAQLHMPLVGPPRGMMSSNRLMEART